MPHSPEPRKHHAVRAGNRGASAQRARGDGSRRHRHQWRVRLGERHVPTASTLPQNETVLFPSIRPTELTSPPRSPQLRDELRDFRSEQAVPGQGSAGAPQARAQRTRRADGIHPRAFDQKREDPGASRGVSERGEARPGPQKRGTRRADAGRGRRERERRDADVRRYASTHEREVNEEIESRDTYGTYATAAADDEEKATRASLIRPPRFRGGRCAPRSSSGSCSRPPAP